MTKLRLFTLVLGILNIIAGLVLATFVILMQNLFALIAGIAYIIFGIAMLSNTIYKILLFWIIVPLTILHSFLIIMIVIDNNLPACLQIPIHVGLIFTLPLWILIFGNIYIDGENLKKLN
jgi:uncharacterized membrane protein HdeD (DUF308 family)